MANYVPAQVDYPSFSWASGKLDILIVGVQLADTRAGAFDINMNWLRETKNPMVFVLKDAKKSSRTSPVSATFGIENNILRIPILETSNEEGSKHYKTVLEMMPNTDPLQFTLTEATLIPKSFFEVVGIAGMFFDGNEEIIRYQESVLANLVSDVMLEAGKSDGVVASLMNTGGLRGNIGAGEVTMGELLTLLPFGDKVVILDVTGRELVAALDNGLTHAGGELTGAFPSIAGMQVNYCDQQPCSDALLEGGVVTKLTIDGTAVEMDNNYKIATQAFLAGGGDNYTMLKEACQRGNCRKTDILLVDRVVEEFRNNSPVTRKIEQRINPISVKTG